MESCTNHPNNPAQWACTSCNIILCPDCVKERQAGRFQKPVTVHCCPNCDMSVEHLAGAAALKPFWKKPHMLLAYPFMPWPLASNLVLCVLAFLAFRFLKAGQVTGLLLVAVWIVYAFSALKATAAGDFSPPRPGVKEMLRDVHQLVFHLTFLLLIFMITQLLGLEFGVAVSGLFLLLAFLCAPAMIILLVVTDDIVKAVQPSSYVELVKKIGSGYSLMVLFLFLLGCIPLAIALLTMKFLPNDVQPPLLCFALNAFVVSAYHLVGCVIFEYEGVLGPTAGRKTLKDAAAEEEATGFLDAVDFLRSQGKLDEAISLMEERRGNGAFTDVRFSEHYYALLKTGNDLPRMLEAGRCHLELLVRTREKSRACQVYTECVSHDPGFDPDPALMLKVGAWLTEEGRFPEAFEAYKKTLNAYPQSGLLPIVHLRMAQLLHEHMGQVGKARELLNYLIKQYPHEEIVPFAKQYLARIET